MKKKNPGPVHGPARRQRGAALIMTMVVLVVMSILVTGFLVSMRTELAASYSSENIQRTKLVAQGAVSHAINLLRTNIPDPAPIDSNVSRYGLNPEPPTKGPYTIGSRSTRPWEPENWAVNPGRLTLISQTGQLDHVDLHTGEAKSKDNAESIDLNRPLPGGTVPPIAVGLSGSVPDKDAKRPKMRVKWVPVLENPGEQASKDNRMIGRYAFWIDDECQKINFNTALGKPSENTRGENGEPIGEEFHQQLQAGMLTPVFQRGKGVESLAPLGVTDASKDPRDVTSVNRNDPNHDPLWLMENRFWSLGHPTSVNLDRFFKTDVTRHTDIELDDIELLSHVWSHGFNRYPEAILNFVDGGDGIGEINEDVLDWWHENRFYLTHYSRAPEFNVFGRPRFVTTNVPISLEGGPLYQLPFALRKGGDKILHLHSLMGNFGFTDRVEISPDDDETNRVLAGNMVNRMQLDMLMQYLTARMPGYNKSFAEKYGIQQCFQIAISIIRAARVGTTGMDQYNLSNFMRDWSYRNTSTNYNPETGEAAEKFQGAPESHYWRMKGPGGDFSMLPQMGGPHLMGLKVEFDPDFVETREGKDYYTIGFKYATEYYMHPFGPVVGKLKNKKEQGPEGSFAFPTRIDLLHVKATGGSKDVEWQLGYYPRSGHKQEGTRNWHDQKIRGAAIYLDEYLGPPGVKYKGEYIAHRTVAESDEMAVVHKVDKVISTNHEDAAIFEVPQGQSQNIQLDMKIRVGMSTAIAPNRPKQMIPLGDKETDVLEHTFNVTLSPRSRRGGDEVSWYCVDPNVAWHKDHWIMVPKGQVVVDDQLNPGEPPENSNEKSKFLVLQRAHVDTTLEANLLADDLPLSRGDEYSSFTRTASPGYWSLLHTGAQGRRQPMGDETMWQTLDLRNPDSAQDSPPDWVMLDLFGATYPMQRDQWRKEATGPDEFSAVSYMNSTAGKINVNNRIYPQNQYFDPPQRTMPLEAVFWNLWGDSGNSEVESFVQSVVNYQDDNEVFDYIGELANVQGYAKGTRVFEQESLLRNMAGCLTTQSNTFGVWGVAQTVNKRPANTAYDEFEEGDEVLGEKRFYALVERYVWPGKDGVPGNAHVNSQGDWDRTAKPRLNINLSGGERTNTLFNLPGSPPLSAGGSGSRINLRVRRKRDGGVYPEYDGPRQVAFEQFEAETIGDIEWRQTTLEDAYNPPQPVIKYRVAYFKYLDQ